MDTTADDVTDIKPDLKDLEHPNKNFSYISHDMLKEEVPSHSASACGVKEEIIYCQLCSYGDVNLSRLKYHILREHPTGAAIVTNCFEKSNLYLHDIKLLCVKETCTFSTAECNVYEEHLISCCPKHQTFSEEEMVRLKSAVKFILDFHSKHNTKPVPGFLDYFSTFNITFSRKNDKICIGKDLEYNSSSMLSGSESYLDLPLNCTIGTESEDSLSSHAAPVLLKTQDTDINRPVGQTNNFDHTGTSLYVGEQERKHEQLSKSNSFHETFASSMNEVEISLVQSEDDHYVSENIVLEIDVAGSPIEITSLKEDTKGDKNGTEKMSNGVCCTKDLHVSSQQSGDMARMTADNQPVDPTVGMLKGAMRMDRGNLYRDMMSDSFDLHSDIMMESGKQSFKINENVEGCDYNMDFLQDKRNHEREKSLNSNVVCGETFGENSDRGKKFVHGGDLIKPRTPTREKRFKCDDCGKSFYQISHLNGHRRTHTGEKPFKCNDCGKAFSRNSQLIVHRRTHTGEKPFKCKDCGKTYSQSGSLIVHRRKHSGERPFKCNDCEKTFSRKCHVVRHKKTHVRDKPFKCNEFGRIYSKNSSLVLHRRTHSGEKPFKCIDCEKTFNRKSRLNVHRRTHTGEKPFKCNDCGKAFIRNNHLIVHRRIHTGEKPFKCKDCGKTYSQSGSLIVHRRTHSGEKPFKCNDCEKTYSQSGSLAVHRRTHSGEKPFECNDCGKTYSQSSSLVIHRRTHSGEKPFKCNDCGKTFVRSGDLSRHRRTHASEKLFECNNHGKTFIEKNYLSLQRKKQRKKTT